MSIKVTSLPTQLDDIYQDFLLYSETTEPTTYSKEWMLNQLINVFLNGT